MIRNGVVTALAAMCCGWCGAANYVSNCEGQSLGDDQKSAVVFDINVKKLVDSKLATLLGVQAKIDQFAGDQEADEPNPGKLVRIVGSLSAPESIAEAQKMSSGVVPIEFYARMQFSEAAPVEKMLAKAEAKHSEKFDRNGNTFYRPEKKEGTPENLLMHRVDDTTVEIATEGYAFLADRNVMTESLQTAWAKTPDDAIRLAVDVVAASNIVGEAVEMGKGNFAGSPMEAQANAFLGLVDNMKELRVSIDLSNDNLITLQATGVNGKEAEELKGGLDALLGLGKMGAQAQLGGLEKQDPQAAKVLSQIVDALNANLEGDEVSVTIPHPAGLEDLVGKFAPMLGMLGGGPPMGQQSRQPREPVPVTP